MKAGCEGEDTGTLHKVNWETIGLSTGWTPKVEVGPGSEKSGLFVESAIFADKLPQGPDLTTGVLTHSESG